MPILRDLLAVLPRTECGQCGYAGCTPYAEALQEARATPDACAPGGAVTRQRLRRLLGQDPAPVSMLEFLAPLPPPQRAVIDPERCIGCAKCLDPCPVDAIVGAPQQLHAVIDAACTGCGLCLPPCPVDCIAIIPLGDCGWPTPTSEPAQRVAAVAADPCTACGDCVPACPIGLDPHTLLAALQRLDTHAATAQRLADCTVCGACDPVCPSHIPLAAAFAHGAALIAAADAAAAAGGRAAARTAARAQRRAQPVHARNAGELPDLRALDPVAARREIDAALSRSRHPARRPSVGG